MAENKGHQNLKPIHDTQRAKELGAKGGKAKKGSKHISTWIQDMLNDETFETNILDAKKGMIEFKGAPLEAIIKVAMNKAINDPKTGQQWAEWLAKHGYGTNVKVEVTDTRKEILSRYGLIEGEDEQSTDGK